MDPQKVKALPENHLMSVHITIRVSPDIKSWIEKNNFSPTSIFHEAIKELGYSRIDLATQNIPTPESFPKIGTVNEKSNRPSVYFKTVRVKTSDGWKSVKIKQYHRNRRNLHTPGSARGRFRHS